VAVYCPVAFVLVDFVREITMATIYQILLFHNPQALQDLDEYQVKKHKCHITRLSEPQAPLVVIDTIIEDLEEIDREMRKRPHYIEGNS